MPSPRRAAGGRSAVVSSETRAVMIECKKGPSRGPFFCLKDLAVQALGRARFITDVRPPAKVVS